MKWSIDKDRAICPQIEDQICAAISLGVFQPGERLKSVREVAVEAGVNPNTVQKAFSELERDGLIFSKPGSGWYVGEEKSAADDKLKKLLREKTVQFLKEMKTLGMKKQQIIRLLEEETDE